MGELFPERSPESISLEDFKAVIYHPLTLLGVGITFIVGVAVFSISKIDDMKQGVLNPLEIELQDEDKDGKIELPSTLDMSKRYTLSFDEKGNAYLR
ncbi:MAG: hypothetical protein Q8R18_06400 [bacterium]|nr:hypothetical protein [bacterium]